MTSDISLHLKPNSLIFLHVEPVEIKSYLNFFKLLQRYFKFDLLKTEINIKGNRVNDITEKPIWQ